MHKKTDSERQLHIPQFTFFSVTACRGPYFENSKKETFNSTKQAVKSKRIYKEGMMNKAII